MTGVWLCAMLLDDRLFRDMTPAAWDAVVRCKADGLRALSAAAAGPALRDFVFFSSLVASRGNAGQSNYAWANRAAEREVEARRRRGLPGLAVQWGPVDGVGYFRDLTVSKRANLGLDDLVLQPVDASLDALHQLLFSAEPVVACVQKQRRDAAAAEAAAPGPHTTLEAVLQRVARVLGEDSARLDAARPLGQLGLDSLSRVELQNWLRSGGAGLTLTPEHSALDVHRALGGAAK